MTKSERNKLIYARYQDGYSQEEIGSFYNLAQSTVSLIISNKKKGIPEKTEENRGSKSRLSDSDLEKLGLLLRTPPSGKGFFCWNKWSVKALIKDEFDVDYHENYIWKIMGKIGFSSQIPQEKDYRQSSEKVSDFKKEKISEIKKSG